MPKKGDVPVERVAEIEKKPEVVETLAEMSEAPCNYRVVIEDKQDPSIRAKFVITPKAANCNRLMNESGIGVLSVGEMIAYFACSTRLREGGDPGLTVADLIKVLKLRYAGRHIGLLPVSIQPAKIEEPPCSSSSTSSESAEAPEPDASTSTTTSPSTPAEPASETPA